MGHGDTPCRIAHKDTKTQRHKDTKGGGEMDENDSGKIVVSPPVRSMNGP